jgi:hypothetical protein
MVATPVRIGFITKATRSVLATDGLVTTKYGQLARDTKDEPFETYFDSMTDTQAVLGARFTLMSADRRRFNQTVRGVIDLAGVFNYTLTTPAVTVIDDERQANLPAMCTELGIDPLNERSLVQSWG